MKVNLKIESLLLVYKCVILFIGTNVAPKQDGVLTLTPPQWIQCDLRYLDMTFLGKQTA